MHMPHAHTLTHIHNGYFMLALIVNEGFDENIARNEGFIRASFHC